MPTLTDRDQLRRNFHDTYAAYVAEGDRMKALLMGIVNDPSEAEMVSIKRQQDALTRAQERYTAAREAYVDEIFGDMRVPVGG